MIIYVSIHLHIMIYLQITYGSSPAVVRGFVLDLPYRADLTQETTDDDLSICCTVQDDLYMICMPTLTRSDMSRRICCTDLDLDLRMYMHDCTVDP